MFKDARVLVTGGAGFIGSALVERLLKEGCRVRAVLHDRPALIANPAVEYVPANLTLMDDCRRVAAGMDVVCHCAASTSGAAMIAQSPLVHVTPNVVMTAQLMEAACLAGARKFLYLSSSVAYPPSGDRPVREGGNCSTASHTNPTSAPAGRNVSAKCSPNFIPVKLSKTPMPVARRAAVQHFRPAR